MSNVRHGIELLLAAAPDSSPVRMSENTARLDALKLFVTIRELQTIQAGAGSIFISEVTAGPQPGPKGITITCVGLSEDLPGAVADAVSQWCMGVLPVLTHWRGGHTCLVETRQVATRSGGFLLHSGPMLARGNEDVPPEEVAQPCEQVLPLIAEARPAARAHWLELYGNKQRDGACDTTCRLNNRDWPTGARALAEITAAWPVPAFLRSVRQFCMLMPEGQPAQELILPSLWERLTGRA